MAKGNLTYNVVDYVGDTISYCPVQEKYQIHA